LRAGDELELHISSLPDMENSYQIRVDGIFYHPLVGEIQATGRTLGDLRAELQKRLAKELKNPTFRLGLKQVAQHQVAVLGEANQQGTFQVGLGATVLDLIAQAGGLSDKADRESATLLRGSEKIVLSLRPEEGGGLTKVQSGDVLYLGQGAPVSVSGEVTVPGVYSVSRVACDPRQAILRAGGAKEEASLSRVRLIRASLPAPVILDLRVDAETPLPLEAQQMQEGDILVVPARQAVVLGAVSEPGPLGLKGGETLIDILPAKLTEDSDIERILVVRAADVRANRETTEEYNLKEYFEEGKATGAAVPVNDGDLVYVEPKSKSNGGLLGSGGLGSLFNIISLARLFF
jgi:protein involved in polysaccharide export with SLBB domain